MFWSGKRFVCSLSQSTLAIQFNSFSGSETHLRSKQWKFTQFDRLLAWLYLRNKTSTEFCAKYPSICIGCLVVTTTFRYTFCVQCLIFKQCSGGGFGLSAVLCYSLLRIMIDEYFLFNHSADSMESWWNYEWRMIARIHDRVQTIELWKIFRKNVKWFFNRAKM